MQRDSKLLRGYELIRYAPTPMTLFDYGGRVLFANPFAQSLYDDSLSFLARCKEAEAGHEVWRTLWEQATIEIELAMETRHGERWHALSGFLTIDPASGERAAGIIENDVSQRRAMFNALKGSMNRFRILFEAIPDAVLVIDADSYRIQSANSAAERLYGYTRSQLLRMSALELLADPQQGCDDYGYRQRLTYIPLRHHRHCDGSDIFVEIFCNTLAEDGQRLIIATLRDITTRIGYERQRQQAQRLETVGRLTGGIAHDFNNLLAVIVGNLELLQLSLEEGGSEENRELLQDALTGAENAADLTQRLLGFSSRRQLLPTTFLLKAFIEQFVRLSRRLIPERITFDCLQVAEDLWVTLDQRGLENALLNIIINARDAMPKGGTLTIAAAALHADEAKNLGLVHDHYVEVTITDTGVGMDKQILAHCFDPFFTTKPSDKGTGLGLSEVYGFITQSGGAIDIHSKVGEGTQVKLYLRRDNAPTVTGSDHQGQLPRGQGESILVVEDRTDVRQMVQRTLKSLGYRTIACTNADEAQELLQSGHAIQLVFSDVLMAGSMDGIALRRWINAHYPKVGVLLTTGYAPGQFDHELEQEPTLLIKPYTTAALAEAIRAALTHQAAQDCS